MERSTVTNNGIRIYSYKNNKINSFCLSLFLRFGAIHEAEDENGIAHLFEHAVFRHLNRIHKGELYKKLDSLGLSFNAETSYNNIQFEITGATSHFPDAAKLISEIFLPFELTASELKPEKDRIKAEILESGDSSSLGFFCDKLVWGETPRARLISGNAGSVNKIGVKRLRELQKLVLSAENTFIYAAGSFTDKQLSELKGLMEQREITHSEPFIYSLPRPADFGNRPKRAHIKNGSYTCVQLSFDVELPSDKLPAIYILESILFGGDSSLIHDALSEKSGLIYSFDNWIDVYPEFSVINLFYDVRSDKLYKSIETALSTFANTADAAEEYIRYSMPYYTDNSCMIADRPAALTDKFGYEAHILNQKYRSVSERKEAFAAVTSEDVKKLAKDIFRAKNLTLAVKTCAKKIDEKRLNSILDILER